MNDLLQQTEQQEPTHCSYCNGPLNPQFYFCVYCATAYKSADSVIPRAMPLQLTGEEKIRKKVPMVWTLFWTYLGVVVGVGIISLFLHDDSQRGLSLFIFTGVFLITTIFFTVRYWRSLIVQLANPGFHWATMAGLLLLIPMLGLNYGYHYFLQNLAGIEAPSLSKSLSDMGLSHFSMVMIICVFPGITEEIAFRGLVQHWLKLAIRPASAILLASALFAALHLNILSAPYLFLMGYLLGWVKYKTGSLYGPMLIHFLHNFIVLEYFNY